MPKQVFALVAICFAAVLPIAAQRQFIYLVRASDCVLSPGKERLLTGFKLAGSPGLLTALHGVADCREIRTRSDYGQPLITPLSVEQVDVRHDVAMLSSPEVRSQTSVGLERSATGLQDSTSTVSVQGYPKGINPLAARMVSVQGHPKGINLLATDLLLRDPPMRRLGDLLPSNLARQLQIRKSPDIDIDVLSIQGHLLPGHSGAPILNASEQVIGIADGGLETGEIEISWAIPIGKISLVKTAQARDFERVKNSPSQSLFSFDSPDPAEGVFTASVVDTEGQPLEGVTVVVVLADGSDLIGVTSKRGEANFRAPKTDISFIFSAGPGYGGGVKERPNPRLPAQLQVSPSRGGGSIIVNGGTGFVPGLQGRLNPILDTGGRSYIYADNIAINGGQPQPVVFKVGKPFQVVDQVGSKFELRVVAMFGTSFLLDYRRVEAGTPGQVVQVQVTDAARAPLIDASVLFLSSDGRYVTDTTQKDGRVSLKSFATQPFTIYCGRAGFGGYVRAVTSPVGNLDVRLTALPNGGSLVIPNGTGYVPGLQGRLNPILDSGGRSYIHADNIAINGGQPQPVMFKVGEAFEAVDQSGAKFELRFLAMGGRSFILDYRLLETGRPGRDVQVQVTDAAGAPLIDASVLFLSSDGRYVTGTTQKDGRVSLKSFATQPFTIYCGRAGFGGYVRAVTSPAGNLDVRLTALANGGSLVIPNGTGYVPDLQGRLNPILDNGGRSYIYGDNIAINGGQPQPVPFEIGQALQAYDSTGNEFTLSVKAMGGRSSLVEYRRNR